MDDVRRNALVAIGATLMGGAIAWVSTVSFASGHSASVLVLVPVVMFVVGAALVIWAIRSKPNSRQAVLKRAIREGHELLGNGAVTATPALNWQNTTAERLREHVGEVAAHGLEYPATTGSSVADRVRAQVEHLERQRKHKHR